MRRYLLLALSVVGLDQWSKAWAVQHLTAGPLRIDAVLNLALVYNRGAAFGFLSQDSGWQNGFFIAVATAIIIAIGIFLVRTPRAPRLMVTALMLVLGGAIGNLIDRIRLGQVIDFIDFHIGHWHWYTFNVADSAITIGAVLLALDAFLARPSPPSEKD
ncbi:MAG: signal peptidase II [Acidiferrobacter sp.]